MPSARIKLFDEVPCITGDRVQLRRIEEADAASLDELSHSEAVYRYLPSFLYEQNNGDVQQVIEGVYGDLFTRKESLILGVYLLETGEFCGLAEFYGLRDDVHKISIGYRLLERFWGRGIASETVGLMVRYVYERTDIELITASTMLANRASARVLEKNGFLWTTAADEDWGFPEPTRADKWFT